MSVKHLVVGWTRRVMASVCTDFLCPLVWWLLMCLFVQHNMRWRQLSFGFSGHRLHNWEISCLRMCVYGSFVCIYHIWICLLK